MKHSTLGVLVCLAAAIGAPGGWSADAGDPAVPGTPSPAERVPARSPAGPPPVERPQASDLADFLAAIQHEGSGLPVSFPDSSDVLLKDISFTYDAAITALALTRDRRWREAFQALQTYMNLPLPSPDTYDFNTAYNVALGRPKLEYRVHGGPIFWVALAMLRYAQATDNQAVRVRAWVILEWCRDNLPHHEGGVMMSHKDEWADIMSTENNWVFYGALRAATQDMEPGPRRDALLGQQRALRRWLGRMGVNRGFRVPEQVDTVAALDVYTHALLVGPESHLEDGAFGSAEELAAWARAHIAAMERLFRVPGTARYDYTDPAQHGIMGRSPCGWLEGTEQVVVAYRTWAPWFEAIGDAATAGELRRRAEQSHAEVLAWRRPWSAGAAIPNTDSPVPILTFYDGWTARPSSEAAVNSTAWAYFGETGYNPYTDRIRGAGELPGS